MKTNSRLILIYFILLSFYNNAIYNQDNLRKEIKQNRQPVLVYSSEQHQVHYVLEAFTKFNINYQEVDSINKDTNNLYLIFNVQDISLESLPEHFIAFQTKNLQDKKPLTHEYIQKLARAIAVWDDNWNNINKYRSSVFTYYYFPAQYEYADPVILPCLLPIDTLKTYKEILTYSNNNNTDIASHLPTIFARSILQNPALIVEAGVRGGESTIAFKKAMEYCTSKLIGLDIDGNTNNVYSPVQNAQFFCMNDLDFPNYYRTNQDLKKYPADIIFIDTSHYYDHTMQEISQFLSILSDRGLLLFHDSYMSPLPNYQWHCINNTIFGHGWDNKKGVIRAIKDSFSISYDETKYQNFEFQKNDISFKIIHYPFCNGLTLIQKMKKG